MTDQILDHRTITGRKKSLATRKSLLSATLRVIGSATIRFPSIEDVIKEAGVARGTFYKHFSSLDQAVEEVSLLLADEWTAAIAPIHSPISNPELRASVGTRLLLLTTYENKEWGRFMLRSNLTDPNSPLMQTIQKDVSDGMTGGKFLKADPALLTQLVMGINWAAFEILIDDPEPLNLPEILDRATLTLLMALGSPMESARESILFARNFIYDNEQTIQNLLQGNSFGISLTLKAYLQG